MFKLYDQFYTSHHNSIKTPDSSTSFIGRGGQLLKCYRPVINSPIWQNRRLTLILDTLQTNRDKQLLCTHLPFFTCIIVG